MSLTWYVSVGTLAGYLAAITLFMLTPGPDMLYVLANATRYGIRASVAAALGVAVGEAVHVAIAVLGLSAIIAASPMLYATIRYTGAAYLIILGFLALRRPTTPTGTWGSGTTGGVDLVRAATRGLLTNLLNPKMIVFTIAFLPQFVNTGRGHVTAQLLILGAIFVTIQLAVDLALGITAGRFAGRLADGRTARVLHRVSAIVFVGIGIRLALA
ncbi:LysE family translocator [Micromonospora sp. NPDC050397]|uniref:LysE family translocator n=1 Tax=Micromonospora sp. NPDC050397 TaxID=3364279 RepID=UPI003850AC47